MRRLLIGVATLLVVVLLMIPFVSIAFGALQQGPAVFVAALARPEAFHAMDLSLVITLIVTVLNALVGLGLSLELVRGDWFPRWLKPILGAAVDLPFAVSPVIGGLMIVLLYGPDTVLGTMLEAAGLKIVYALPGMTLATIFVTFPLMIRELVPLLGELGCQPEEASATLGASSWMTFRKVTWPSLRGGFAYGLALTVARSLGEFGAVLVVSGNIMNQTQTATTLVYQDAENFDLVSANSVALLLGAASIAILLLLELLKNRKEREAHAH